MCGRGGGRRLGNVVKTPPRAKVLRAGWDTMGYLGVHGLATRDDFFNDLANRSRRRRLWLRTNRGLSGGK